MELTKGQKVLVKFYSDIPWRECEIYGVSKDKTLVKLAVISREEPYYTFALSHSFRWYETDKIQIKEIANDQN